MGNGANGDPGTGLGVTTGKNPFFVGGQGNGLGFDSALAGQGQALFFRQEQRIRRLADGGNDQLCLNLEFTAGNGYRASPARGVGLSQLHPNALHPAHLAVLHHHFGGGGEILDIHTLGQGVLDFILAGRHFGAGPAVEDAHLRRPQPRRHAGCVNGHIAATDDDDPALHQIGFVEVSTTQEFHPVHDPFGILPGDIELLALMGADAQIDRFVTLSLQLIEGEILAQAGVELDLHSQAGDGPDFLLEHLRGQPVVGNAHTQHAARH